MAFYPDQIVLPPRVEPGDTIGVAAPAGPFKKELFDQGIQVLKSLGYRVFIPEAVFKKTGYLAGSDRGRAETLNRLFADPKIKAIICARGGYGAMRTLRFIDFQSIRENPKILLGFSDVSALLSALYTRCSLVTFHGPTVTHLAGADDVTIQALASALSRDQPMEIPARTGQTLRPGSAVGRVVGGNLTTLCHLLGTDFAPDFRNHLLLLEDVGEAPYRVDRMLTQMRLAGCLDAVAGVVLGSFKNCGRTNEIYRIVTEVFNNQEIPVLAGFDIGHEKPNLTVPLGMEAVLDADRQVLQFHRPATVSPLSDTELR